MSRTTFYKYHGTGNDFILFGPEIKPEDLSMERVRQLCDRHFGIGSDGILFIGPSDRADFKMRMLNPDGSEAEMCGNGIRCFARHLRETGLTGKNEIPVETLAGIRQCRVFTGRGGLIEEVEVGMGKPDYARAAAGMEGEGTFVAQPVAREGHAFKGTAVSMGNPHLVIFHPLSVPELEKIGPLFEAHPLFSRRVNVEFADMIAPQHLRVLVYERGAGITLACGTGACATVAAAVVEGRIDKSQPVRVDLLGGTLTIRIEEATGEIWMRGNAVRVFEGRVEL